MNVIQAVGIGLSLACLLNCVAANGGQALPIRSLKKGAFSGIREVKQEVVKSADAWEKLWKQHSTAAGMTDKIPAVDFSNRRLHDRNCGCGNAGQDLEDLHQKEFAAARRDDDSSLDCAFPFCRGAKERLEAGVRDRDAGREKISANARRN